MRTARIGLLVALATIGRAVAILLRVRVGPVHVMLCAQCHGGTQHRANEAVPSGRHPVIARQGTAPSR